MCPQPFKKWGDVSPLSPTGSAPMPLRGAPLDFQGEAVRKFKKKSLPMWERKKNSPTKWVRKKYHLPTAQIQKLCVFRK